MDASGIYCIENLINGKKYIGQSKNIAQRRSEHRRSLVGGYHYNEHMQRSFNKYGIESFSFTVVKLCRAEDLDNLEEFYIKEYNTLDKTVGYNRSKGGHKPLLSEASKRKISETRIRRIRDGRIVLGGYKFTDTQRERMSESRLRFIEDNPGYTEVLSESKATISVDEVRRIKMLLYMDMELGEVAMTTGVGFNIVKHIDTGVTYQHILPELNYYIKNRYVISKQRQARKVLNGYRDGLTYKKIASDRNINIRTAIRIVDKNKTPFDEYMRGKAIEFEKEKKHNMVRRMHKTGWSKVKIAKHYSMSRNTIDKILQQ